MVPLLGQYPSIIGTALYEGPQKGSEFRKNTVWSYGLKPTRQPHAETCAMLRSNQDRICSLPNTSLYLCGMPTSSAGWLLVRRPGKLTTRAFFPSGPKYFSPQAARGPALARQTAAPSQTQQDIPRDANQKSQQLQRSGHMFTQQDDSVARVTAFGRTTVDCPGGDANLQEPCTGSTWQHLITCGP